MRAFGDPSPKIAGDRTASDWANRKVELVTGSNPERWIAVFDDFFVERMETRYLRPIETLLGEKSLAGEGFSIVAIQCSLIEFLGAMLAGKLYRYRRKKKDPPLEAHEYSDGKEMFIQFLTTATPFRKTFSDGAVARDFYENVRCGLLHEARTKKGWRINTRSERGLIVDHAVKIVWRDELQLALREFISWYRQELARSEALQVAFVRKFDNLCEQ